MSTTYFPAVEVAVKKCAGYVFDVSKAFTRESDEDHGDEIALPRSPLPPGVKRSITKAGADRFREQATALLEQRKALLDAGGSPDPDTPGKVRRIDAAIQRIQQILDSAVVADPPADPGKIGLGASIRIRDQLGEQETYQIVGPDEADAGAGRISSISPLAQALMNRRSGDTVRFRSPAGEQELTILAVHY